MTVADWPGIEEARNAVAQLTFVDQGTSYLCSGGLMNTVNGPTTPYLLTANHCFGFLPDGHTFNQAAATSLEAVWQYQTATCNGPFPDESLFPSTLGSTLLATGTHPAMSDYTFLQLSEDPPANSVALGWTTANVVNAAGLVLYRLSYPLNANMIDVDPQIFTRELITPTPNSEACSDAPPGLFLYEQDIEGGTGGGSSGSPAMLADLRVVGQESAPAAPTRTTTATTSTTPRSTARLPRRFRRSSSGSLRPRSVRAFPTRTPSASRAPGSG